MVPFPWVFLLLAAPGADPAPTAGHQDNPIFVEVLAGVTLSARDRVPLPPPYMAGGLTAAQQVKVIKALCIGPNPNEPLFDYDDIMHRGIGIPYYFNQREVKTANPDVPAYLVDVWFITYGDLKALSKKEPQQLFAANPAGAESTVLEEEELEERSIKRELKAPLRERYVHTIAPLIDRVEVGLTSRIVGSRNEESLLVASRVDARFATDKTYGNYWRSLPDLDNDPAARPGPKRPLEGGGFYLKITRLYEPRDALFVEFHQVSLEPKAWFGGTAILRGKIPLWVREEVRRFRGTAQKTLRTDSD
jgi:hypothetical protein